MRRPPRARRPSARARGHEHPSPHPWPPPACGRYQQRYTIISVDDHLIEPPDLFEGRLASRFADRAPRVERDASGCDWWVFEDERVPLLGADAIKGWERGKGYLGPVSFATFSDPSTLPLRHQIGVDHILLETDHPHSDSSWPDTQDLLRQQFGDMPADEVDRITHRNAAALYRHPLPAG